MKRVGHKKHMFPGRNERDTKLAGLIDAVNFRGMGISVLMIKVKAPSLERS